MLILLPRLGSWLWWLSQSGLCVWQLGKVAAVFVFLFAFFLNRPSLSSYARKRVKLSALNMLIKCLVFRLHALVLETCTAPHMRLCRKTALASWDSQSCDCNHKLFQGGRNGGSVSSNQLDCPGSLLTRSDFKRADETQVLLIQLADAMRLRKRGGGCVGWQESKGSQQVRMMGQIHKEES